MAGLNYFSLKVVQWYWVSPVTTSRSASPAWGEHDASLRRGWPTTFRASLEGRFPALIPAQQDARIIYITFQLAEVAVPRKLFAEALNCIEGLRLAGA